MYSLFIFVRDLFLCENMVFKGVFIHTIISYYGVDSNRQKSIALIIKQPASPATNETLPINTYGASEVPVDPPSDFSFIKSYPVTVELASELVADFPLPFPANFFFMSRRRVNALRRTNTAYSPWPSMVSLERLLMPLYSSLSSSRSPIGTTTPA